MAMKLGELLTRAKVLTERQLETALAEQEKWGGKLGQILVRMGYLSEDLLTKALAKQLGLPRVDLENSVPSVYAMRKVKLQLAEDYAVLPIELKDEGATLVVAMADPLNVRAVDEIKATSGCRQLVTYLAGEQEIRRYIGRHYASEDLREEEEGDEFKIVDAQGKTVMKSIGELEAEAAAAKAGQAEAPPPPVAEMPRPPVPRADSNDPVSLLKKVEQTQRKEVQALKIIVELLIEKGVFSRDEYLAKVGRR
jgi:hypothetical protein